MIGNDIIDLNLAKQNSRWKEQRFLDKLFSKEEQSFILSDTSRFQNIWRLWSMKESAYKIISRLEGRVRFNPTDYLCSMKSALDGQVIYKNTILFTTTNMNQKFIQTTAFFNRNWISEVIPMVRLNHHYQQVELRRHVIDFFNNDKYWSFDTLDIRKDHLGIPHIYKNDILQMSQLSLSHHGYFGAWAVSV